MSDKESSASPPPAKTAAEEQNISVSQEPKSSWSVKQLRDFLRTRGGHFKEIVQNCFIGREKNLRKTGHAEGYMRVLTLAFLLRLPF